jgi:NAD-dependent SIR2 family protein deacetylase
MPRSGSAYDRDSIERPPEIGDVPSDHDPEQRDVHLVHCHGNLLKCRCEDTVSKGYDRNRLTADSSTPEIGELEDCQRNSHGPRYRGV